MPVFRGPSQGLEVAPLLQPVAENRPAHLLGTDGAHGAAVAVEFQAARFEVEDAVVQQAAHLAFGVIHHVLVDHAVDPARQDGVEVRHEVHIVAIVPTERGEVVGEVLALGENAV